jgi:hypothetical protein
MSARVSPELALAFACCRWPRCEAGDAAVRAAASGAIDWERFAGVIARNRISALAKDALDRAGVEPPARVAAQLAEGQSNAAFTSLGLARESIRLQRAFDAAGLPALIVKGAPMAMLAYGDLGSKESWDIDLLTDEVSVFAARGLLEGLGYAMSIPARLDGAQFARFVPHAKEAALLHRETGITTELHWRLVDNERLLPGVGVRSEAQTVSLGAGTVRTLADAPLLAYLCVHGAAHNWSRLKWLAEVGAFLGNRSTQEVERLYAIACGYGAERPVRLALLLCQRMLGLPLSSDLEELLSRDKVVTALAGNTLAGLEYGDARAEHLPYTQAWLRARIGALFQGSERGHLARELRLLWTSPFDRATIALPSCLGFLYHLLRIPLWLRRIGFRFVQRLRTR